MLPAHHLRECAEETLDAIQALFRSHDALVFVTRQHSRARQQASGQDAQEKNSSHVHLAHAHTAVALVGGGILLDVILAQHTVAPG
jgi:hypothetical protein